MRKARLVCHIRNARAARRWIGIGASRPGNDTTTAATAHAWTRWRRLPDAGRRRNACQLHPEGHPCPPGFARRGDVAMAIMAIALVLLILLPTGQLLLRLLQTRLIIARTWMYLDEVLPQAYHCLDEDALADGRLVVTAAEVESFVRQRFVQHLPPALQGQVVITSVALDWIAVAPDPAHWLGDRQPLLIPTVICQVQVTTAQGPPVNLQRAVDLVMEGP